jgi:hypothetical protein
LFKESEIMHGLIRLFRLPGVALLMLGSAGVNLAANPLAAGPLWAPVQQDAGSDPTTAAAAIRLIDLTVFPRLDPQMVLSDGPTYAYYNAGGTLAETLAFYREKLAAAGWKEIPGLSPPTPQYADLLFTQGEYFLRAALSEGSETDVAGVMLASLGNVDVRTLPALPDSQPLEPSTPVNAARQASLPLAEAAAAIEAAYLEAGWQPVVEFQSAAIDVPHYKSFTFRKQAVRVTVGAYKDPNDAAAPVNLSCFADHLLPFDVPTVDSRQPLRFDASSGRAAFVTALRRAGLTELVKKHGAEVGWTVGPADGFVSGEQPTWSVQTGPQSALAVALVETGGEMLASFEPAPAPADDAAVAEATAGDEAAEAAPATDATDMLDAGIQAQIDAELKKAFGGLSADPASPATMEQLKAQADELRRKLEGDKDDDKDDDDDRQAVAL